MPRPRKDTQTVYFQMRISEEDKQLLTILAEDEARSASSWVVNKIRQEAKLKGITIEKESLSE